MGLLNVLPRRPGVPPPPSLFNIMALMRLIMCLISQCTQWLNVMRDIMGECSTLQTQDVVLRVSVETNNQWIWDDLHSFCLSGHLPLIIAL